VFLGWAAGRSIKNKDLRLLAPIFYLLVTANLRIFWWASKNWHKFIFCRQSLDILEATCAYFLIMRGWSLSLLWALYERSTVIHSLVYIPWQKSPQIVKVLLHCRLKNRLFSSSLYTYITEVIMFNFLQQSVIFPVF
jgi:hypothetical protein